MRTKLAYLLFLICAWVLYAQSVPVAADAARQPRPFVIREIDGQKLNAYVFQPQGVTSAKPTAAVLLFHGGGWVAGSAEWTSKEANRFAALGLMAVTIDYRLSEGKITPIEALDDTRAAFHWVRRHAADFNIDPKRVAGYCVSAGGHLVAAAVTLELLAGDLHCQEFERIAMHAERCDFSLHFRNSLLVFYTILPMNAICSG